MTRRVTLEEVVRLDYNRVAQAIGEFLNSKLEEAGAKGYVVGLSGGVDSATAFALAVKFVGRDRVLPLIMPDTEVTPQEDVEDAKDLASLFGATPHVINITPIVAVYKSTIPVYEGEELDKVPLGNLRARIRMSLLYYYANKLNRLVLGTGDRSEILIGYFTKYGDGGVDVLPIGILYKNQVRRLAKNLGVPDKIAFKPSSPRLWPGQTAEGELGVSYEEVDLVLYSIFDLGLDPREVPSATGVPEAVVSRVMELHRKSEHKRVPPPSPPLDIVAEARI
ncbi:MAG: NAD+ synthase [Desulfurococcales archaeon]|nr:NAD+ synthase [Desulfurococcales archaeon]